MDLTQVTILVLIGIFRIIPGNEPCKFGPTCDYPCHCQNDDTCDTNDGSCPSGCDDGDLMDPGDFWYTGAWYGYGCQIGNVAYDKDAIQGPATSGDRVASRAVDGNHDPDLRGGSCTHTTGTVQQTGWWEVDLMGDYVVLAVNLTNRIDCGNQCRDRTRDLDITVSGSRGVGAVYDLCKRVGNEGRADATYAECQQPLRGRYVRLERLPRGYQKNIINLCEIQVYGYLYSDCLDGYSGVACGTSCNCKEPCDDISGECVGQMCMEGWQGTDCQTECPSGAWGSNCAANCNCMNTTEACDRFVGRCMSGCASGYDGVGCNEPCPSGTWGSNCLKMCNCVNEDETCDRFNGRCMSGCSSGFRGDGCDLRCIPGTWGLNCGKTCNCMNEAEACNHIYGRCMSGCTPGYGGVGCNLILPRLSGMMEFSNVSSSTIGISFSAWSRDNSGEEMPTGYIIQRRSHGTMVWMDALNVDHNADVTYHSVILEGLEPGTVYYVRIVPFINDAGGSYRGTPTEDASFETLSVSADGQAQSDHSATIAGVVCFIIIGILVIVVVVLVWRRSKRPKPNNEELEVTVIDELPRECTENGYEYPNNEKESPPQNTYEEIVDVVKSISLNAKIQSKRNNDTSQTLGDVITDGPGQKTHEHPLYQNQSAVERPIPLTELALYMNHMTKTKDGFKKDFEKICNRLGIRSGDFEETTYEHLIPTSNDVGNMNYVNTADINKHHENPKGYIATGVPPNSTAHDLWSVVWERGANRIVILSACKSNKEELDYEDWPAIGKTSNGEFEVTVVSETKLSHFTIKALFVTNFKMSRSCPVYCYHFTGWPDTGVPEDATNLLEFRRKVHILDDMTSGPLIVLSDLADGRVGTFIALDHLSGVSKNDGAIDVVKFMHETGPDSSVIMQTSDQYEFVHRALLEAFHTGNTIVAATDLQQKYPDLKRTDAKTGESILQTQFSLLERLKTKQKLRSREGALLADNVRNNRDPSMVPLDRYRPLLRSHVDGTNDYINAVYIDGYCQRNAYIATQLPEPYALVDIWRLVYDHNCSRIIALDQPDSEDVMTPVYWPIKKEKPFVAAQLSVTLLNQQIQEDFFSIMELEITLDKKNPHKVRLYQFSDWPIGQDTPTSLSNTLQLLDHGRRWGEHSTFHTTTFLCKSGFERCGLMIAACYMLEKLKMDDEVDVFQAVKQVRISRPELVTSVAQYEFLHELAIAYIDSCEEYSNFK